ncbi:MAG TPA: hypothetical protein P5063_04595 [Methanomassiliicoccales archaeon]|jgi:predicted transcriptional regulator|nr:hypothetical protein [Methanomassiliicoccales archaeon]HRR66908.1 hypothetical protein [Methanomassiliicoccales archaeon]
MVKGALNLSRLLTDEYAGRILSLTFSQARSVQEICAISGIPIAVAYRRVAALEAAGLLRCLRTEIAPSGKKCKYFICQVQVARLTFREGSFEVEVEWKDQGREELAPMPSLRT